MIFNIRVRFRVQQDGPCTCMCVLGIIQGFILYISLKYM
jgi:hypothetical protein